ncbi:succinate dehydrogenase [ubiquinone] cytochrome b small subunit, mitochondrial [Diutina catenulata]
MLMLRPTTMASRVPMGVRTLWKPRLNFDKFRLIKQPAGGVVGGPNDAYKPGPIDLYEGSAHWTYERIISSLLIPLAATPLFVDSVHPMFDTTFSVLMLFHCHTGFTSCIIDYIPERVYGIWHKMARHLLTTGTFVSLYGIYVLETESNGLFDLIKQLWWA